MKTCSNAAIIKWGATSIAMIMYVVGLIMLVQGMKSRSQSILVDCDPHKYMIMIGIEDLSERSELECTDIKQSEIQLKNRKASMIQCVESKDSLTMRVSACQLQGTIRSSEPMMWPNDGDYHHLTTVVTTHDSHERFTANNGESECVNVQSLLGHSMISSQETNLYCESAALSEKLMQAIGLEEINNQDFAPEYYCWSNISLGTPLCLGDITVNIIDLRKGRTVEFMIIAADEIRLNDKNFSNEKFESMNRLDISLRRSNTAWFMRQIDFRNIHVYLKLANQEITNSGYTRIRRTKPPNRYNSMTLSISKDEGSKIYKTRIKERILSRVPILIRGYLTPGMYWLEEGNKTIPSLKSV